VAQPRHTLAIETSNPSSGPRGRTQACGGAPILAGPGVALGRAPDPPAPGLELVAEEPLIEREGGSDDLVAAIDRLCRAARVRPGDIGRIAVSIGPGGYTALRTAIAAAKVIAEATGARTIPVRSDTVAFAALRVGSPALVCLASKAETTHAALVAGPDAGPWWAASGRGALRPLLDGAGAARLDESVIAGRAVFCPIGVIGAAQVAAIRPAMLVADRFLPDSIRAEATHIGASVIEPIFAASSVLRLSAGLEAVDSLQLAPIYPREPDAVTQWRLKGLHRPPL
jgi:hypothetical protein